MNEVIKADNYIYTKNIYPENINNFEYDLKEKKKEYEKNFNIFFNIINKDDSFSSNKKKVNQICDFLKDITLDFILVFDSKDSFQLWANLTPNQINLLTKKFDNDFLEKIPKDKKIEIFKINKENGLSSCVISCEKLKSFKKKDSSMEKVYKKELGLNFSWKKLKISREKLIKDVQDYLKFKHNQIYDMVDYKNHKYKLEDREDENFYKQVRNASFEFLKKPQLNNFVLSVHVIRRMDERDVSPSKFLDVINNGKQVVSKTFAYKIFIQKGATVIVADNSKQKFLTVIKDNNFVGLDERNLIREMEQGYDKFADISQKKEIQLKDLNKFKTIVELKEHLNITQKDYDEDEARIQSYKKRKYSEKDYNTLSQPLMSNPPYVGDMLTYIRNRQLLEKNKISNILDNFVTYLEIKFSKEKIFNEDLQSAFSKYWDSPIVKNKGKLINMPLNKTWSLNFKTLHGENLSGDSEKESWAKEVKEIMKKPIIVLKYRYPDDSEDKHYILDGSHRYNEANTKNEFRLNPEEDYKVLPIFIVHLEEKDKELDPDFFEWVTKKRIPNGNWS